ncbi:MAG: metallophosphoesterase [Endomicrobia bacterium]|nr:metallophosphoesterase [Endomicrobiia bacterium]
MRILAVSDAEDIRLQNLIEINPEKLGKIDYIFSCGDLSRDYLEYITDSLNKSLYYIVGNHFVSQFYGSSHDSDFALGGIDVHAKPETVGDYILTGFGGSMRYNPGKFQFEENEMAKIVKKTTASIKIRRFFDSLAFRKKKEMIVISHAPIAGIHDRQDVCHSGFKAFRNFISETKPLLWLHGHVHDENSKKTEETMVDGTLVVNVVPSKIIEITGSEISIRQIY